MSKLKIDYKGGYRQVSKYLIREHDANFAVIIDAIVSIHNMNSDKLCNISGESAAMISNGFLSRNTGLGIYIVKANVKKIEGLGLMTAIKKGQGNTKHYVIHIDRINKYIEGLAPKFKQWFENSLKLSKKDIGRSENADLEKFKTSDENFATAMAELTDSAENSNSQLVGNKPTQSSKTTQPNAVKPTVEEKIKETNIETTTDETSVVVDNLIHKSEAKKERKAKRNYETTREPASSKISAANWKRLENAYNDLPLINNQGRFYVTNEDNKGFFSLSEYKQDLVIESVKYKIDATTTASRPSTYIELASKGKLEVASESLHIAI